VANDYYTRVKTFLAGTKAKGSDVVSELDLLVAGLDKLPSQARMDSGNPNYVVAGGTANALTITSPGTAITTYTGQDGLAFSVKATATNTGATTVNIDGVGAVSLVASDGSTPTAASITANGIYTVVYNETTGKFVFADPLGSEAAASASAAAAADSEAAAAASAAGVNLPSIESGDALKHLRANAGETGYELQTAEAANVDYQEFTSSGTWTKPANALTVYVECIGGGGGGYNRTSSGAASGGCGGTYTHLNLLASDLASTETITIGAGGDGGANSINTIGTDGGTTSFGPFLSAYGGRAGTSTVFTTSLDTNSSSSGPDPAELDMSELSSITSGYGGAGVSQAERRIGGNPQIGGGGGGGGASGPSVGAGGVSVNGGSGGASNGTSSVAGTNGSSPGGGGGGCSADGGGGDGADGHIRVWTMVG